jgi:hypothetical protein
MVDFDEEQLKKMYIKFHAEEEQNGMITREKFDKVCTCRVPAVAILLQRHTTAGHGGSWPFDTASSHHMDPSASKAYFESRCRHSDVWHAPYNLAVACGMVSGLLDSQQATLRLVRH